MEGDVLVGFVSGETWPTPAEFRVLLLLLEVEGSLELGTETAQVEVG